MSKIQNRDFKSDLKTRDSDLNEKIIEGYFAVFNSETELFPGGYEEISPGAFDKSISGDIRALINHDNKYVLGRTKANTLELKVDNYGLFGRIKINDKDIDALNLYERVKRGDIDQCSFGFLINKESVDFRDDGTIKWTLKDVDLYEVSICTFPAYENTSVSARTKEFDELKNNNLERTKTMLKERIKNA